MQARRISRSRCSAESLDASGLQVIDSSMDLQLAARNLPPMFHTIQVRTYITKTHETSGYVSTVLFTTRWTAVWFCNLYDVWSSAFLVPTIPRCFHRPFFLKHSFRLFPSVLYRNGKTRRFVSEADESGQLLVHRHAFPQRKQDNLFPRYLLKKMNNVACTGCATWRRWWIM